jgi:hypothetical protein
VIAEVILLVIQASKRRTEIATSLASADVRLAIVKDSLGSALFGIICLSSLLVAMFAANAHAASAGLTVGGRRAMPLLPRAALQILFITAIALAGFAV